MLTCRLVKQTFQASSRRNDIVVAEKPSADDVVSRTGQTVQFLRDIVDRHVRRYVEAFLDNTVAPTIDADITTPELPIVAQQKVSILCLNETPVVSRTVVDEQIAEMGYELNRHRMHETLELSLAHQGEKLERMTLKRKDEQQKIERLQSQLKLQPARKNASTQSSPAAPRQEMATMTTSSPLPTSPSKSSSEFKEQMQKPDQELREALNLVKTERQARELMESTLKQQLGKVEQQLEHEQQRCKQLQLQLAQTKGCGCIIQ